VQLSVVVALQVVQVPPPVPHSANEFTSHVFPLQHPVGHDVALHTHWPPMHAWPVAHWAPVPQVHAPLVHASERLGSQVVHALPPVPQEVCEAVVQVVPLQQPVGHDVPSQPHEPATQCWPAAHAGLAPQVQTPLALQVSALTPHAMQAAPPVPQALVDGVLHTAPVQHPFGHPAAHEPQTPLLHA
jgi:hypothetical protein